MALLPFHGAVTVTTPGPTASGPVPGFLFVDRSFGASEDPRRRSSAIARPLTLRGGEQHTILYDADRQRTGTNGRTAASGLSCRVWFALPAVDGGRPEPDVPAIAETLDVMLDALTVPPGARVASYQAVIAGEAITASLVDAGVPEVWRITEWRTTSGAFTHDFTRLAVEAAAVRAT